MIEDYRFGFITINGKGYNHDLEVRWNGEILPWWRRESHIIEGEDLKRALKQKPEIIVIGTGKTGIAEVFDKAEKIILNSGIELVIEKTDRATEIFNTLQEQNKRVIGLFHLTC